MKHKLFAVGVLAMKGTIVSSTAVLCGYETFEEAFHQATVWAQKTQFPEDEGWYNHKVCVIDQTDIAREVFKKNGDIEGEDQNGSL